MMNCILTTMAIVALFLGTLAAVNQIAYLLGHAALDSNEADSIPR